VSTTIEHHSPAVESDGASPTGRPATFVDAVRAEWLKLISLRSTWITLVVTAVLGIGIGALISHLAATNRFHGHHFGGGVWDPTAVSFRALTIAQLALAVLGALVVTSEYGTGMIRTSLTAVPRRGRFLAAKVSVFAVVALVVGEVVAFAAFLIGQAAIGSAAPQASLGGHDVLRAVIGAGLYLALVGVLATAVGALVRTTAAAISAMVALLFVLPGIVAALPASWSNAISEWWPTQAGSQVFAVTRGAHTLSAWSGFGVLVGFTVVVIAVAAWLLERRDA
jgi:ABC-2 type transport system permease protein